MRIYWFIASEKTTDPVRLLWRVLGVSTSGYCDWAARGVVPAAQTRREKERIGLVRRPGRSTDRSTALGG
jgi:hypothetical protein